MSKRINILKEDIEELYINQNLTRQEVAKRLNIKEGTLKQKLKKFNIKKPIDLHIKNIEDSCLKKYGIKNGGGSQKALEKAKQTNLKKFGYEWGLQSPEIINKRKQTNIEKYNTENVFAANDIKIKIAQTKLNRYGNKNYNNQKKIKHTNIKKYGVEYYMQTQEFRNKSKQTCLKKYNQISFSKTQAYKDLYENQDFVDNKVFKCINTKKINGTLFKSKLEKEITDFIKNELKLAGSTYIKGKGKDRFEIDYFIKSKNIGIEVNGCWWHSIDAQDHKSKDYHYKKMLRAKNLGIDLIQIWEDQWLHKCDIIKDILKARFNIISNRIYARQCNIKEIDNNTYKCFCNKTHIQGYRPAKIKLGLYYNNELVQVASFNKCKDYGKRKAEYEYEWIRGCIASNNQVIGGTSKLLKYFIKKYNPNSILCYADANLFNGKGYEKAGFEFVGYTGPDKFYIENNTLVRHLRNPYKYNEFKIKVKTGKYMECYGAGSLKFVWKSNKFE